MRMRENDDNSRPDGWWVLGLAKDPTPGDSSAIDALAGRLHDFGDTAAKSQSQVRGLLSDRGMIAWLGDSATAFKDASWPFPEHLGVASKSYHEAADGLDKYVTKLNTVQSTADTALGKANAALSSGGVSSDSLQSLLGGVGSDAEYSSALKKILLDQQAPTQVYDDLSPHVRADLHRHGEPPELSADNAQILQNMIGYRTEALEAAKDAKAAEKTCADALHTATDLASRIHAWSYNGHGTLTSAPKGGGTFDQRFAEFGGSFALLANLHKPTNDDQNTGDDKHHTDRNTGDHKHRTDHDHQQEKHPHKLTDKERADRDLKEMQAALAALPSAAALKRLEELGADLAGADPAMLQAFFADGGAATLARLSLELAPPGGRDPSAAAQAILGKFGIAVAEASRLSDEGVIKLPPHVFDPLTQPQHGAEPITALMQHGPDGSQWGHTLLDDAGAKALGGGVGAHDGGIILQHLSQNPEACHQFLSNEHNAQTLLHSLSANGGDPVGTEAVGHIITSATSDEGGTSTLATQATGNLFHALDGNPLPAPVAQAVAHAAAGHLGAFAQGASDTVNGGRMTMPNGGFSVSPADFHNVLGGIVNDPQSVGIINTAIDDAMNQVPPPDAQTLAHFDDLRHFIGGGMHMIPAENRV